MSIYVDIEKTLGDFHLKVKFSCNEETFALLGPSGCGKSMTLKCIAGIETPDCGKIVIDDQVVYDSDLEIHLKPQQRHAGLMFQNYALFPHMTVIENLKAGANKEKDNVKKNEMIEKMLRIFQLEKVKNLYPDQLSGGQQQRVALARIMISKPSIILLDEPFSALDSHLRFQMERELYHFIQDFAKTVILVSHNKDEVYRLSDQIAILNKGMVECMGDKNTIFSRPKTIEAAILTGFKNISDVEFRNNRLYLKKWGFETDAEYFPKDIRAVAIDAKKIRLQEQQNRMVCTVIEEIENPDSFSVLLRHEDCKHTEPLIMEIEKKEWEKYKNNQIEVGIATDDIIGLIHF